MTSITVIVPIFNGIRYLPLFLESLEKAIPTKTQLIFINDGSSEPVFNCIPNKIGSNKIIKIQNDMNYGYSVAVNKGYAAAKGDIVLELNTDLILEEKSITALIDFMDKTPNVGIIGSKLLFPTTGFVQHIGMAFGLHSRRHVYMELPSNHPLANKTRPMQILTGAISAVKRNVFEQIGPLDERYFNYNEDLHQCMKANKAGYVNYTCADSVAYHWVSQSGPARFAKTREGETIFWSEWAGLYKEDLSLFTNESLEFVINLYPELEDFSFIPLNLCRSRDENLLLDCLNRYWPEVKNKTRHARPYNNPNKKLWLLMELPHIAVLEPQPYIYIVDSFRDLSENNHWFDIRRNIVKNELILDLSGVAITTKELQTNIYEEL